jgi:large subunit ribosomal protein L17
VIRDRKLVKKLFTEIAPEFESKNGGYTRVLKLGRRRGDAAPTAVVELLMKKPVVVEKEKGKKGKRAAKARTEAKKPKVKTEEKAKAKSKEKGKKKKEEESKDSGTISEDQAPEKKKK